MPQFPAISSERLFQMSRVHEASKYSSWKVDIYSITYISDKESYTQYQKKKSDINRWPCEWKNGTASALSLSVGVEERKCEYLEHSLPYRLPDVLLSLISLAETALNFSGPKCKMWTRAPENTLLINKIYHTHTTGAITTSAHKGLFWLINT